ncbi:hypothetical protein DFH06DRAFT_1128155 [Mycena polygramma]|nr:hypothetical protein DFH06DRAFT_1128155 [Mycena polygramma]
MWVPEVGAGAGSMRQAARMARGLPRYRWPERGSRWSGGNAGMSRCRGTRTELRSPGEAARVRKVAKKRNACCNEPKERRKARRTDGGDVFRLHDAQPSGARSRSAEQKTVGMTAYKSLSRTQRNGGRSRERAAADRADSDGDGERNALVDEPNWKAGPIRPRMAPPETTVSGSTGRSTATRQPEAGGSERASACQGVTRGVYFFDDTPWHIGRERWGWGVTRDSFNQFDISIIIPEARDSGKFFDNRSKRCRVLTERLESTGLI